MLVKYKSDKEQVTGFDPGTLKTMLVKYKLK